MVALIIRPFGTKQGIDFDRVESQLIEPVLASLDIRARTTSEIAARGNLRLDMVERLLAADLVIADISTHNASVYYELGVRHALRDRMTVLIRAEANDVPFDLRTDRCVAYDAADPGAAVDALRRTIEASMRSAGPDSPVFMLLPGARPTDLDDLRPVPGGFREEVQAAADAGDRPKLAVLADEADESEWRLGGLRLVASAQIDLQAWPDVRSTLDAIRRLRPDDVDAGLGLGFVMQRLGDLPAARAALERVLAREDLAPARRAEAWARLGAIISARWQADWREVAREQRAAAALRSPGLGEARGAFDRAFLNDRNHWYSGINALALLTIELELAELEPDVWSETFAAERNAPELRRLRSEREDFPNAVRYSLMASRFRDPEPDLWRDLAEADLTLLTSRRPALVAAAYRRARARMVEWGPRFAADSAARQLRLYVELGVLTENALAALGALELAPQPPTVPSPARVRTLVFSGHRIDDPGRANPRFPPDAEAKATGMIRAAIEEEQRRAGDAPVSGIAGGASGGDIIFHEQCAALGIPTELLLALPRDEFSAASVVAAGAEWLDRFLALWQRLDVKILSETEALPDWLAGRDDYSIWQRNNRWILHSATSRADADVTLIVLWDGRGGDGPGGTEDMVELARSRGVRIVHLDAAELLADQPS